MDDTNGQQPRIPPEFEGTQVNSCKNFCCENFGVPASTEQQPRGRGAQKKGADPHYLSIKSTEERLPALRCRNKNCRSITLIKNNQSIVEEFSRLKKYLGPISIGCPGKDCTNGKESVYENNGGYWLSGKTDKGVQRYQCKACKTTFSIHGPTAWHRKAYKNIEIFKLLINKEPFRRILSFSGITPKTLYDKIRFLYWQCLYFSGNRESKLSEMEFKRLYISVDRQDYMTKWISASRRSMIKYLGITSADIKSGYVFGDHLNFDTSISPEELELRVDENHDQDKDPPFREYARFWLNGDYKIPSFFKEERYEGDKSGEKDGSSYLDEDPRPVNSKKNGKEYKGPTIPLSGVKVHSEYTAYGHFLLLRHLFQKAKKVRFYLDGDLPLKPACLSVFHEEIKKKQCDVFSVRITKGLSVPVRQKLIADANDYINLRQTELGLDRDEVIHRITREEVEGLIDRGELQNGWMKHPIPTMNEPIKLVACHTAGPDAKRYNIDRFTRLFYQASLHPADRFFMLLRRMISIIERPIATPSSKNRKWHGYAPYDPQVVGWLIEIYRTYYNYVFVAEDGKTAAMRLGLAQAPIDLGDIVNFYTGNVRRGNRDRQHRKCYIGQPPKKKEAPGPRRGRPPRAPTVTEKPEIPGGPRVFLDIETDSNFGRRTGIWLIGVYDEAGGSFKQFLARNPAEEKKILLQFTEYCAKTKCPVMVAYAGNNFDRDTIIRRLKVYKIPVPALLKSTKDVLKPIKKVTGFQSYALKSLGSSLGYPFKHQSMNGALAAMEYENCVRLGKPIPDKLLEYNKDDVYSLMHVVKKLEALPVNESGKKKRTRKKWNRGLSSRTAAQA